MTKTRPKQYSKFPSIHQQSCFPISCFPNYIIHYQQNKKHQGDPDAFARSCFPIIPQICFPVFHKLVSQLNSRCFPLSQNWETDFFGVLTPFSSYCFPVFHKLVSQLNSRCFPLSQNWETDFFGVLTPFSSYCFPVFHKLVSQLNSRCFPLSQNWETDFFAS